MSRFFLILLLSLFFAKAHAGLPGICGQIRINEMSNEDLENVLILSDFEKGRSSRRIQCGIPGEKLEICSSCVSNTSEEVMTALRPIVGAKLHLNWHANWHKIRSQKNIDEATFTKLRDSGYIARETTREEFASHLIGGSLAGEDFFYMHRLMIKMVQMELASTGRSCLAPWKELPSSIHDSNWPVPKNFADREAERLAAANLVQFQNQFLKLRDSKVLRTVTLNRLGQIVEPLLHQNLHAFYRSSSLCSAEAKAQGYCDDLVPVETSPLNKHFWKIHGMLDLLIGDWLAANQYKEIAVDCRRRADCYQWQSPWIGQYPAVER